MLPTKVTGLLKIFFRFVRISIFFTLIFQTFEYFVPKLTFLFLKLLILILFYFIFLMVFSKNLKISLINSKNFKEKPK